MPILDEVGKNGILQIRGGQLYFNNLDVTVNTQTAQIESNQSFWSSNVVTSGSVSFSAEWDGAQPDVPSRIYDNNYRPVPKTGLQGVAQGRHERIALINVIPESSNFVWDAVEGGNKSNTFEFIADAARYTSQGTGRGEIPVSQGLARPLGGATG